MANHVHFQKRSVQLGIHAVHVCMSSQRSKRSRPQTWLPTYRMEALVFLGMVPASASRSLLIVSKRAPENSPENSELLYLCWNHWDDACTAASRALYFSCLHCIFFVVPLLKRWSFVRTTMMTSVACPEALLWLIAFVFSVTRSRDCPTSALNHSPWVLWKKLRAVLRPELWRGGHEACKGRSEACVVVQRHLCSTLWV